MKLCLPIKNCILPFFNPRFRGAGRRLDAIVKYKEMPFEAAPKLVLRFSFGKSRLPSASFAYFLSPGQKISASPNFIHVFPLEKADCRRRASLIFCPPDRKFRLRRTSEAGAAGEI